MCPDISHICVIILAGAEQPSLTWNSNQSDASIQCNTYNEIRQSPNTWTVRAIKRATLSCGASR